MRRGFLALWWRMSFEIILATVIFCDLIFGNFVVPVGRAVFEKDSGTFLSGYVTFLTIGFIACVGLGLLNGLILAILTRTVLPPSDQRYWPRLRLILAITILIPVVARILYGGYYDVMVFQGQPGAALLDLFMAGFNVTAVEPLWPYLLGLAVCLELSAWWAMRSYEHRYRQQIQPATSD